jgi:hypothetical protein
LTEDIRDAYGDLHCPDPMEDHSEGCKADDTFDWWFAEVQRVAAEKAWDRLADAAYPLYDAAEDVLFHNADREILHLPLARLGAQNNPYRTKEEN